MKKSLFPGSSVVSLTAWPGHPSYGDVVPQVTPQVQYAPQPLPPGQPMYEFTGQAPGVAGRPLQPVPYMVMCLTINNSRCGDYSKLLVDLGMLNSLVPNDTIWCLELP